MKQVFLAKAKGGTLNFYQGERYHNYLQTLDGDIEVSFKDYKGSRSDRQRRYYWAVIVDMIAEKIGQSREETNEFIKWWFNPKMIDLPNGEQVRIGSSIESEPIDRVEEIYSSIRQWAGTELGLFIPLPNEEDIY